MSPSHIIPHELIESSKYKSRLHSLGIKYQGTSDEVTSIITALQEEFPDEHVIDEYARTLIFLDRTSIGVRQDSCGMLHIIVFEDLPPALH